MHCFLRLSYCKAILIFFFLFFAIFAAAAQTEQDLIEKLSLAQHDSDKINIYINLHNATYKADVQKAEAYARQVVALGKSSGMPVKQMMGYRALARCKRKIRNYSEVLFFDSLTMQTAQKINTPSALYTANMEYATDYMDAEKNAKALPYLQTCILIAAKENNPALNAKAENRFGWYYATGFQYSEALPHFEKAIAIYEQLGEKQLLIDTKRGYAEALMALDKTENVPQLLNDAVENYRQANKIYSLAQCLALVGKAHFNNGNFTKGLDNFIEAKKLFAVNDNKPEMGMAATDIAGAYLSKKDFDKAKTTAQEAEEFLIAVNYEFGLVALYTFWGRYYTEVNDLATAENYFKQAAALAQKNNFRNWETEIQRYWAVLKYKQNNSKGGDSLALNYADRIVKEREQAVVLQDVAKFIKENKITDTNTIKLLSVMYSGGGVQKIKNTLNNKTLSELIPFDSLLLSSSGIAPYKDDSSKSSLYNHQLLELETQYHVNQKNDSLKIQIQANQIAETKLQQRKLVILSITGLAALLAAGVWLQFRHRRRAEADRNKIELLQHEIHHRVKNNLGVISRLVDVAGKNITDSTPLSTLKSRIKSIELLHKHLYNETSQTGKISLQHYVIALCNAIVDTFESEQNIKLSVDATGYASQQVAEKLGLIINELVTNAYKHAFVNKESGRIDVNVVTEKSAITLIVKDNGTGIPEIKTKGYGMKLINGLTHELRGKSTFKNENGTNFQMTFSITG